MDQQMKSSIESDVSQTDTLRFLREKRGISVVDLCAKIGVKPSTVYGWESGRRKPRPEDYRKLLDALDLCRPEKVALFTWYLEARR